MPIIPPGPGSDTSVDRTAQRIEVETGEIQRVVGQILLRPGQGSHQRGPDSGEVVLHGALEALGTERRLRHRTCSPNESRPRRVENLVAGITPILPDSASGRNRTPGRDVRGARGRASSTHDLAPEPLSEGRCQQPRVQRGDRASRAVTYSALGLAALLIAVLAMWLLG